MAISGPGEATIPNAAPPPPRQAYTDRLLKGGRGLVAWQRLARFRRAAREIRAATGGRRLGLIVDLGAADGIASPFLSPLAERLVGVNYYHHHSVGLRARFPAQPVITADARRLPIAGSTADAVVSLETLHLLPGREARIEALEEVRRILRRDGVFVCSVAIELGLPAVVKYVGRRYARSELAGVTFSMMLRHCFYRWFDVSQYDNGRQIGFDAYRFANDAERLFAEVRRIRVPLPYPMCTNLMLVCRPE